MRKFVAAGIGTRARAGQQPAGMRNCSSRREGCLLLTVWGCSQARGLIRSGHEPQRQQHHVRLSIIATSGRTADEAYGLLLSSSSLGSSSFRMVARSAPK